MTEAKNEQPLCQEEGKNLLKKLTESIDWIDIEKLRKENPDLLKIAIKQISVDDGIIMKEFKYFKKQLTDKLATLIDHVKA